MIRKYSARANGALASGRAAELAQRSRHLARGLSGHVAAVASNRVVRGLAALGRLHPAARLDRHGVEVIRDIEYQPGGLRAHRLDIYRPTGQSGPLPVVVHVHGGGFRTLSKDTHWLIALLFARAGYLVCNIGYRLAPRHPFPAALADTCAAYTWVVQHIHAHGGDAGRVIVAGESAGANLVAALTLATCVERPEPWARQAFDTGVVPVATVPFCGLFEVSNPERFWQNQLPSRLMRAVCYACADAYLGYVCEDAPLGEQGWQRLDLANPVVLAERMHVRGIRPQRPLPPFFMAVGTWDPLIEDTRRMAHALHGLGAICHAGYYHGELHAFHALIWREQARRAWCDALAFLQRHVTAPGEP